MSKQQTPIELLSPDPEQIPRFIDSIWGPSLGAFFGFGMVCCANFGTKRPIFSGIQKHVIGLGLGATIGKYADDSRQLSLAERDAVLRHYVELHPEDFPMQARKKWSEVIRPWIPIR